MFFKITKNQNYITKPFCIISEHKLICNSVMWFWRKLTLNLDTKMASAIRCSLVALLCLCFVTLTRTHEANEDLVSLLQSSISGKVFPKGSYGYAKRRIVHNGLCSHIFPDIIVTPHTTEDVSAIVKIARAHNQVISVRSGGHSFTCTSLKQGKCLAW